MEPTPHVRRMDWLDYGRLVAALWITVAHYCYVGVDPRINPEISNYGILTTLGNYAEISLQFFFMTSGLVITLIAQQQRPAQFVTGRLVRVVPTFVICLTLTAVLTQDRSVHPGQGLGQYLANLTFYPQLFGYRFIDASYWTLGIELVFYVLIGVIIATNQTRRLPLILAIWIAAQVVCLPLGGRWPLISPLYHFVAAGAVMAMFYLGNDKRLTLPLLGVSLCLCLHTAYQFALEVQTDPLIQMSLVVLMFLLFALMRGRDVKLPFARRIGSMTYPLYLLHFQLGMAIIQRFGTADNRWVLLAAVCGGFVVLSLVLDDVVEFRLRWFWKRLFGGAVEAIALRLRSRESHGSAVGAGVT